ncbi:MAG: UV DNA damage repair endonuclease UvsE [Planctomycetota bacterium]
MNVRLGLCCSFHEQPIKFTNTTATAIARLSRHEAIEKLSRLCLANARALEEALRFCRDHGIGDFRVVSQILPLKTHPKAGYRLEELPDGKEIRRQFERCGEIARNHDLRTSFHPDQFVVLNSPRPEVVAASVREFEYQAEVAEWINADVVNIHAGGAYGDKRAALDLLERNLEKLSHRARERLTLENDDTTYSPADLLPFCQRTGIPLVYDVHHHRCLPDALSIDQATEEATATWDREPMFHISSPLEGWDGPKPARHHDYIDARDFPDGWRGRKITVEVEAKAKELAVLKLRDQLIMKRSDLKKSRKPKATK